MAKDKKQKRISPYKRLKLELKEFDIKSKIGSNFKKDKFFTLESYKQFKEYNQAKYNTIKNVDRFFRYGSMLVIIILAIITIVNKNFNSNVFTYSTISLVLFVFGYEMVLEQFYKLKKKKFFKAFYEWMNLDYFDKDFSNYPEQLCYLIKVNNELVIEKRNLVNELFPKPRNLVNGNEAAYEAACIILDKIRSL